MKIIVIDLEFTQPNCKIIQIAAAVADLKRFEILGTFNKITNPGELPDQYITDLTGITPEMVTAAEPLETVLKEFWAWATAQETGGQFGAWGNDVFQLREASKELGIDIKTRIQNMNIKEVAKLFRSGLSNNKTKKTGGLRNTMQLFGYEFVGNQHDASWDVHNTVRLLFFFQKSIKKQLYIQEIMIK